MAKRVAIRPLPDPVGRRRAAVDVHFHLRELILQGELPPGLTIAQAEIARVLGVGLIPVREAFRMLQQEGLIEANPDRRSVVALVVPGDQDALWAERILVESLASRMSAGRLTEVQFGDLATTLGRMADAANKQDNRGWVDAHRDFHTLTGAYSGDSIRELVRTLTEKTSRYLMLHGMRLPHSYEEALRDHENILTALKSEDADAVEHTTAIHVGRPALILLAQVVPSFDPSAVRAALVMTGATDFTLDNRVSR